jgi:hypothetical protein
MELLSQKPGLIDEQEEEILCWRRTIDGQSQTEEERRPPASFEARARTLASWHRHFRIKEDGLAALHVLKMRRAWQPIAEPGLAALELDIRKLMKFRGEADSEEAALASLRRESGKPSPERASLESARIALAERQIPKARRIFDSLMKTHPGWLELRHLRIELFQAQGKKTEAKAERQVTRAIDLQGGKYVERMTLELARLRNGDKKKCLELANRMFRIAPRHHRIRAEKGRICRELQVEIEAKDFPTFLAQTFRCDLATDEKRANEHRMSFDLVMNTFRPDEFVDACEKTYARDGTMPRDEIWAAAHYSFLSCRKGVAPRVQLSRGNTNAAIVLLKKAPLKSFVVARVEDSAGFEKFKRTEAWKAFAQGK